MEKKEDHVRELWDIEFEWPYIEIFRNRFCLSEAAVDCLGPVDYIVLENSDDKKTMYVRKTEMQKKGIVFTDYIVQPGQPFVPHKTTWYVRGIEDRMSGLIDEGYDLQKGIRLMGSYCPDACELRFDLTSPLQLSDQREMKKTVMNLNNQMGVLKEKNNDV